MLLRRHKTNNSRVAQNATLEDINIPESDPVVYSKTNINRMNLDGLRELAKKSGLTLGEDESGTSLKSRLIDLLVK